MLLFSFFASAQENTNTSKFKQLSEILPTLMFIELQVGHRHEYYQQKADYVINVQLDEKNHVITGDETITYTNNSPDVLNYLWIQLDQNVRAKNSASQLTSSGSMDDNMSFWSLKRMHDKMNFDGGFKLNSSPTLMATTCLLR